MQHDMSAPSDIQDSIPTPEEHAANWRNINRLHPANRFRLMFNQPLLKEDGSGVMTLQEQIEHMGARSDERN